MGFFSRLFGSSKPETRPAPAVCDVCTTRVEPGVGYLLTTTQVTTADAYWDIALSGPTFRQHDPKGERLADFVSRMAGYSDPWLLCEKCIENFEVDREVARHHRAQNTTPEGCGRAEAWEAALAAGRSWSRMFDAWPESIRIRNEAPPADGTMCDFCRRRTYADEKVAIMSEAMLSKFEDMKTLKRRGHHSRTNNETGAPAWLACSLCTQQALKTSQRT